MILTLPGPWRLSVARSSNLKGCYNRSPLTDDSYSTIHSGTSNHFWRTKKTTTFWTWRSCVFFCSSSDKNNLTRKNEISGLSTKKLSSKDKLLTKTLCPPQNQLHPPDWWQYVPRRLQCWGYQVAVWWEFQMESFFDEAYHRLQTQSICVCQKS